MHISLKTSEEIEALAEGGSILHTILHRTAAMVEPGITTFRLNEFFEAEILKAGGTCAFKGYGPKKNPFPAGACISVNDEVVHGIPSKMKILNNGDIVSIDVGMKYKNLYTDTAITVGVGKINSEAQKIIDVTKKSLELGIKQVKPGNRIGDISHAIQSYIESHGFSVVRDLVGHGVGHEVHEDPSVPCYGKPHTGTVLEPGLVIAIEPMVCQGEYFLQYEKDGWTISTRDGGLAGHFEHTIAVTEKGYRVLT